MNIVYRHCIWTLYHCISFTSMYIDVNVSTLVPKIRCLILLFSVIGGFVWFWMESLHKNIQLILEFLNAPFLVLHSFNYTIFFFFSFLLTFLMMLSVILQSMLMILLSKFDQAFWSMKIPRIGCSTWIWSTRYCGLSRK